MYAMPRESLQETMFHSKAKLLSSDLIYIFTLRLIAKKCILTKAWSLALPNVNR